MKTPKVFESEYRFCQILWENEPIGSGEIAKICKQKLDWSRTTTYTVIRRLSDRGVIENKDSVVRSLVTKAQVQMSETEEFVDKTFEGSLPSFIAAFAESKKLSNDDIDEIQKMIDRYKEELK